MSSKQAKVARSSKFSRVVPLAEAWLSELEVRAVVAALRSGRLALGPRAQEFERLVARFVGVRHGVAVSSGTAGLHLVVRALGIGEGDEVITSPFSFVASANCILFERARPVFADIRPDSLTIDPDDVVRRITSRTKAILAVDVFGHPADWPRLAAIARRYRLALIEDACEALGSRLGRRRCGSFGDAAVVAFYPNKQLTTGEGGMVLTNSRRLAEVCRSMANQGRRSGHNSGWLEHVRLGYNYRMDELSAALGLAQFSRLRTLLAHRGRVARMYNQLLGDLPGVSVPYVAPGVELSWFVYVVRLAGAYARHDRDRIINRLCSRGVECGDYFRPIHLEPFYRRTFGFRRGDFPVAEAVGDRTIALPFSPRLTQACVRRVVAELKAAVAGNFRG